MFKFTKKDKRSALDKEIDAIITRMGQMDPSTKEYHETATALTKLLMMSEKQKARKFTVTGDAMMIVAGNLLGIGLILGFEKIGIITSKAVGFIMRGRL